MTEIQNSKQYDLEDRTLKYAKQIISFVSIKNKIRFVKKVYH
jgi:hypothetical protein